VAKSVDSGSLSRQEVQTSILRASLVPLFGAWELRDDLSVRPKDRWDSVQTMLQSMKWSLCRFRDDALVLSDQTLCLYGARPGREVMYNTAWARHGIGVGLNDAARFTVALTPRLGLLLTPTGSPERLSAPTFNRTTIYNARRFVLHSPGWPHGRENLKMAFDSDMERQRMLAPVFFTNQF
jgi:hypothetical protein